MQKGDSRGLYIVLSNLILIMQVLFPEVLK